MDFPRALGARQDNRSSDRLWATSFHGRPAGRRESCVRTGTRCCSDSRSRRSSSSRSAQRYGGGLVADLVATVLGLAIFLVVFGHPGAHMVVAAVVAGLLAIGWIRYRVGPELEHGFAIAYHVLVATFMWIAVVRILREVFRTPRIGGENVRGAICGYLIAGGAWGSTNGLTYLLAPAAYTFDPKVTALLVDWHGRIALFSYYSFAQMLTIGYADVTPVRAPATTLSLLAALFGLFYTAVVVSQRVGMAQTTRSESPGGGA